MKSCRQQAAQLPLLSEVNNYFSLINVFGFPVSIGFIPFAI